MNNYMGIIWTLYVSKKCKPSAHAAVRPRMRTIFFSLIESIKVSTQIFELSKCLPNKIQCVTVI